MNDDIPSVTTKIIEELENNYLRTNRIKSLSSALEIQSESSYKLDISKVKRTLAMIQRENDLHGEEICLLYKRVKLYTEEQVYVKQNIEGFSESLAMISDKRRKLFSTIITEELLELYISGKVHKRFGPRIYIEKSPCLYCENDITLTIFHMENESDEESEYCICTINRWRFCDKHMKEVIWKETKEMKNPVITCLACKGIFTCEDIHRVYVISNEHGIIPKF